MGLDAYVNCRCWQDGVAIPPPVGPVGIDEDGCLDLLLPWDGNEDAHHEYWQWRRVACPHEDMEVATERISNWSGYRYFQQTLAELGWAHFPTMRDALPNANGGSMPAVQAALMLRELDVFEDEAAFGDEVVLVDEDTGEVEMRHIAAYRGVVMLGPGYHAGLDPDGFFVRDPDADPPATLFRSRRFRQEALSGGVLRLSDDTSTICLPMQRVGGDIGPERLVVETRPRSTEHFSYLVGALRRVCEASVATGNPVMWT